MNKSIRHIDDAFSDVVDNEVDQLNDLNALYDELLSGDCEHGDVSITDEITGDCLSIHRGNMVVYGNLFSGNDRHVKLNTRADVISIMSKFCRGLKSWESEYTWKNGYGNGGINQLGSAI